MMERFANGICAAEHQAYSARSWYRLAMKHEGSLRFRLADSGTKAEFRSNLYRTVPEYLILRWICRWQDFRFT